MGVSKRRPNTQKGQALIEMIFILPLIIVLIVWLMQGVEVVRASAEQQKYLRLNLFLRLNNYAKYTVDYLGPNPAGPPLAVPFGKGAMWVTYENRPYSTKTLAGSLIDFQARQGAKVLVRSRLGICVRPECD